MCMISKGGDSRWLGATRRVARSVTEVDPGDVGAGSKPALLADFVAEAGSVSIGGPL